MRLYCGQQAKLKKKIGYAKLNNIKILWAEKKNNFTIKILHIQYRYLA